jgi:hypothetical protein
MEANKALPGRGCRPKVVPSTDHYNLRLEWDKNIGQESAATQFDKVAVLLLSWHPDSTDDPKIEEEVSRA